MVDIPRALVEFIYKLELDDAKEVYDFLEEDPDAVCKLLEYLAKEFPEV